MIHTARIQSQHDPAQRQVRYRPFGFFFKPILERLRPLWWVRGDWVLPWPMSEAAVAALEQVRDDITPPDTILPDFADQIIGGRDQFYGLLERPASARDFEDAYFAATHEDHAEWDRLFGPMIVANHARYFDQVVAHVATHGSHQSRFLDAYPVEFAFIANDGVWWIATRQAEAIAKLAAYARHTPGMVFRKTAALGM